MIQIVLRNHINNARLIAICSVLCLCIGCSSSSPNENTGVAEATVTLLDWRQSTFVRNQGDTLYNDVRIDYKIENTGSVDISSYEVYFRAETINNKAYEGANAGEDLKVGEIDFMTAQVPTQDEKITKVEITGQLLE